ncbi:hypothetical protein D8674_040959 [Pyrus ussuriensis x Pyrus communis]|uniref:Uncharacterized protein n=1 Tax=Pyrus ussuriensis x Pyrus communis TaxID=2448454 RepID=A0A5N5FCI5_9ROSA|nr:hypothetical protein D8674_040959 [Pyrus ussuriensis x Pyrus communis]
MGETTEVQIGSTGSQVGLSPKPKELVIPNGNRGLLGLRCDLQATPAVLGVGICRN